jgi:hypothetical protein
MIEDIKLPPITKAYQNKVLTSSRPPDGPYLDANGMDQGPPREGPGITSMTPIASRRMSGNALAQRPPTKGSYMRYGKAPK